MFNLGEIYRADINDNETAFSWYVKAAELGIPEAKEKVKEFEAKGYSQHLKLSASSLFDVTHSNSPGLHQSEAIKLSVSDGIKLYKDDERPDITSKFNGVKISMLKLLLCRFQKLTVLQICS